MKNNGNFRLLNMEPKILISHYDLNSIRHIVDIAPQEAQWFHRIQRIEEQGSVHYRIYEMYIPEQICSLTQVESDPLMMVKFFKELKELHGLEKTNEIMKNLTVWCHSHHNMGVGPSGQDVKQFAKQCKDAMDADINHPQLMMIFNKKDTFYCKLFDPKYGLVFENLPLSVDTYNFEHIDAQAKVKFKKPIRTPIKRFNSKKDKYLTNKKLLDWKWEDDTFYEHSSEELSEIEVYIQSNEKLSSSFALSQLAKTYSPKTSNKKFFKSLKSHLTPVSLAAFSEAICMDSEIIYEMGTKLTWLNEANQFENDFEDLKGDLNAVELSRTQIHACLIFIQKIDNKMQQQQQDEKELDLDTILNEFGDAITQLTENTYQNIGW